MTSTYGKQSDLIVDKIEDFSNDDPQERLNRAELWYSVHYEMTNILADFFVRLTGKLYVDIESITRYQSTVMEDCTRYLSWDKSRICREKERLRQLLIDTKTFYIADYFD